MLGKKKFSFTWKDFKNSSDVYKLHLEEDNDILGVMGLVDWPEEKRMEIKLLASARENIGKKKIYDGITGCLIAFACNQAVAKYGAYACVSLLPKTELISHYMQKYHMRYAGWQLYLEGDEINKLIKEYL